MYKKTDFDSEDEAEVIGIDSHYGVEDDSGLSVVPAEDNTESGCKDEGGDVESGTKDEDDNHDFSRDEEEEDLVDQDGKSVDTDNFSEVKSEEESEEENEDDSDDSQDLDNPDKEEYGDIMETDSNPDFEVILQLIVQKIVRQNRCKKEAKKRSCRD